FWITNAIFMEATGPAIARLSREKAVEMIFPNHEIEIMDDGAERIPAPRLLNNAERGLRAIGAHQMWAMGYTGYGRKAMIIDTGEEVEHPALHNQFAYHTRELSEAWASPGEPQYCSDHGSHVTGTIVGLDRLQNDTIGVAFNGQWMGGPVVLSGCQYSSSVLDIFETFQWALNPDGNPATTDDMPDVINNSWGSPLPSSFDCGEHYALPIINAVMTAGIASVHSAGNEGPGSSTIGSPAINNNSLVRVFSVGNLNGNDNSLSINPGSSRGPSVCGGTESLLIKPEVSAPGTDVRSSVPGGRYISLSGTSMAAPHVSGAVLLLKEAFPYLTGEEILLALYFSAIDLGTPGEDNAYGMGIINVPAAFQYLIDQGHAPVPPVETDKDVILLRAETRDFNCGEQLAARLLVENGGTETITSLDIRHGLRGDGLPVVFSYRWEGGIEPGQREYIQLPAIPSEPGEFEYTAQIYKVNGEDDPRPLNNQLKQQARVVSDELFDARIVGNGVVCQNGQAVVQSLHDGPAAVRWYDALVEGSLLGIGKRAVLPVGEDATTVYMEVSPIQKTGREDNQGGAVQFSTAGQGLLFDVYTPCTIKSVKVYAEEAGNRLLILEGPDGSSRTLVVPVGAGEQRIPLNVSVEPGEGWELRLRAGKALGFNVAGSNYPYTLPNVLSIRRSTQSPVFYHYFYDWEVEFSYFCGRTPVEIPVRETENTPQPAFSPANAEVDLSSGLNEVSFTDLSEGATFWWWSFGDGSGSTLQNPTHAYSDTGRYQVILAVLGEDGCISSAEGAVTVTESNVSSASQLAQEYGMEV
ncbi:MAG: S8 family serine peptidase, partial [Phaeodactylibacter sp.]|nr:S8 family serine peptidase [Phaeodactylibacter sp.]